MRPISTLMLATVTVVAWTAAPGCDDPQPVTQDASDSAGSDAAADSDSGADASLDAVSPGDLAPTWTQLNDMPEVLWGTQMYGSPNGFIRGFGGNALPVGPVTDVVWLYGTSADMWGTSTPADGPPARYCHCMTAIPEMNAFLIVGGRDSAGDLPPGAWLFDWQAQTWTTVPGNAPAGTIGCHAGWLPDAAGGAGRVVVFGGQGTQSTDPGGMDTKTWLLDPSNLTWELATPANSPPPRRDGAVANDTAGGRVLMFGGQTAGFPTPAHTDDLWAFDGTDWSPVAATGDGPGPRRFPGAAFDPSRRLWVIFAGTLETYDEDDLWLFDAASDTWHALDKAGAPAARAFAAMAWDEATQAFYLFGGGTASLTTAFQDAYRLTLN